MSMVSDAYHAIGDTLYNLVTGLGTAKDPRSSTQYGFYELDRSVLERMYRSDWLARRIVDLPAEDAAREWRSWMAARPQMEKIDLLEKKLELQKKFRMALIRARLYGGGALVIGVDQGQPEEELDFDAVGLGDLKFVVVCNRWELAGGPRIYNVDSPWYTRPEYYTVSTPMFGFYGEEGGAYPRNPSAAPILPDRGRQTSPGYGMVRVHPSRIIEFGGNELPDWRLAPLGGGWGDSVLQTVDDSLKDFGLIMGGLASMINDMKCDVIRVPDLSRKLSTAEMTQKTLQRFGLANMAKSSINTLLLDKDEEWQRIQTSFGSTPELIRVAMTVACAAGGVPESRLMGNAPHKGLAGTGSSGGEVDIRNYYDDIASQQKSKYKPMLYPLDRCLQQSALGKYDPSIDYEWNPLYQPNPAELAAVALQKAQTTQVYVNTGLINEDALREATISQLTEDGVYPGLEDALDEFGAEPEEPPAPMQALPPTPPPGMVAKGQFEANPFHMLRAQAAAKSGQPVRVPPNRPSGPPKLAPVPPGMPAKDADEDGLEALFDDLRGKGVPEAAIRDMQVGRLARTLDEDYRLPEERYGVGDFNPNHDPDSGRFTSGEAAAAREKRSQAAKTGRERGQAEAARKVRSAAATAAHAQRRARQAEPYAAPSGASEHETGMSAVASVIAAHKGHPTKGQVEAAAKEDVKTAVEAWAATQHLRTPTAPKGIDPDTLTTAYKVGVFTKRFFAEPGTGAILAQTISRNTLSFVQKAAAGLPAHALEIAHKALVDRIVDYTTEAITDVALVGIGSAATALGGFVGAGAAAAASPVLHAEIEKGLDIVAEKVGFTPEHIREALHGVGHALLGQYRKWKHFARHELIGTAPIWGTGTADAEPDEEFDPLEATLQALAEVLGEEPGDDLTET